MLLDRLAFPAFPHSGLGIFVVVGERSGIWDDRESGAGISGGISWLLLFCHIGFGLCCAVTCCRTSCWPS